MLEIYGGGNFYPQPATSGQGVSGAPANQPNLNNHGPISDFAMTALGSGVGAAVGTYVGYHLAHPRQQQPHDPWGYPQQLGGGVPSQKNGGQDQEGEVEMRATLEVRAKGRTRKTRKSLRRTK